VTWRISRDSGAGRRRLNLQRAGDDDEETARDCRRRGSRDRPGRLVRRTSYQLVEGFFKLPAGRKIGSTAGITVDRDGKSIWTFDRCGDQYCVGSDLAPIQKFDASGKLVTSFGAGCSCARTAFTSTATATCG
jgi:hypothetical protein